MREIKNEGERLAVVETQITSLTNKINGIENSMSNLHGKFDTLTKMLTENYVAKETFEEYKKNRGMERIITILITAAITGLVAFFLRENKF